MVGSVAARAGFRAGSCGCDDGEEAHTAHQVSGSPKTWANMGQDDARERMHEAQDVDG